MDKDRRYEMVKVMWQYGKIKTFADLFIWIPKTTVAHDMGKHVRRFNKLLADPRLIKEQEIAGIAKLFEMPKKEIKALIRASLALQGQRRGHRPTSGSL